MNSIQIFQNERFGEIRTITIDGEVWFVGKDVATALGYEKARNAIGTHVDAEDKKEAPIQGVLGGRQNMTIINESGLYALIFGSKLDSAKAFKHWVTSEVLPSIRKHGIYRLESAVSRPARALPLGQLASLLRATHRLMLDIGSTPQELAEMARRLYASSGIPAPVEFTCRIPEQLSVFPPPKPLLFEELLSSERFMSKEGK